VRGFYMNKKIIGAWGEKVVKNYLENKGYLILEANWHYRHKELDMIVYKDQLIGVEVKTRTSLTDLSFTVLKAKQVSNLRIALNAYCRLHHLRYHQTRLDLIIVTIKDKKSILIKHHQDI